MTHFGYGAPRRISGAHRGLKCFIHEAGAVEETIVEEEDDDEDKEEEEEEEEIVEDDVEGDGEDEIGMADAVDKADVVEDVDDGTDSVCIEEDEEDVDSRGNTGKDCADKKERTLFVTSRVSCERACFVCGAWRLERSFFFVSLVDIGVTSITSSCPSASLSLFVDTPLSLVFFFFFFVLEHPALFCLRRACFRGEFPSLPPSPPPAHLTLVVAGIDLRFLVSVINDADDDDAACFWRFMAVPRSDISKLRESAKRVGYRCK